MDWKESLEKEGTGDLDAQFGTPLRLNCCKKLTELLFKLLRAAPPKHFW